MISFWLFGLKNIAGLFPKLAFKEINEAKPQNRTGYYYS
jgi:hypothetical protein